MNEWTNVCVCTCATGRSWCCCCCCRRRYRHLRLYRPFVVVTARRCRFVSCIPVCMCSVSLSHSLACPFFFFHSLAHSLSFSLAWQKIIIISMLLYIVSYMYTQAHTMMCEMLFMSLMKSSTNHFTVNLLTSQSHSYTFTTRHTRKKRSNSQLVALPNCFYIFLSNRIELFRPFRLN